MANLVMIVKNTRVTRQERGWIGHYCRADQCLFRRNTLLTRDDIHVVVSTVGLLPKIKPVCHESHWDMVNGFAYFETKAFHAKKNDPYSDPDVGREIDINSDHFMRTPDDVAANNMHENVVYEIAGRIDSGDPLKVDYMND